MAHKTHPGSKTNSGKSEQTFGLLFESHPIPMFVYDLKSLAILRVNDALVEKYGYSRDEFQVLTLKDIIPAQDAARLLKTDLLYLGEWRHQCKDGRVIDVDITSHKLEFDGHPAALVMAQDITERGKMEENLTDSEVELRALFAFMQDVVMVIDRDGIYCKIAPTNPVLLFKPMEELLGKNLRDVFAAEQAETFLTAVRQVLKTQRPIRIEYELLIGERLTWFSASISPMDTDHTLWVVRDITDRKRAEAALRESEGRYRTLFDSMMDGIYRSTHEGKFVDINPAMVKMFGYSSKEEMLEVDIKNDLYFAPEERGSHILDTGQEEVEEYRMRRKDGSEIWVEDHGYYIHNEQGMPIYHEGMLRDITARKQVEEGLRRAKESLELSNSELEHVLMREQQLARTDGLTGLCNYRYFFELASHEFSAAMRYQRPLAVVMFDTDYLKQVNDTLGHMAGDNLLVLVAQTAVAQLRAVDVLARYGGDEFVVLLTQTSAQQAFTIAERIRVSVAALQMQTEKGPLTVTLSIGIAEVWREPADESVERIVQRADKALYAAKQTGRNRTVIFGSDATGAI